MRAGMAAAATHSGIVALEPRYIAAGKLIVATGLRAAAPAIHLMPAERLIGESVAFKSGQSISSIGPKGRRPGRRRSSRSNSQRKLPGPAPCRGGPVYRPRSPDS